MTKELDMNVVNKHLNFKLIRLIEKMTDGEKIELVNFLNAVQERVEEEGED